MNSPRIVHDEIDGEVIAIDLATGTYFSMRDTARSVWRLLADGPVEVDDVTDCLLASYPAAPPAAAEEIRAFVEDLVGHELLCEAPGADSPPPDIGAGPGPYASPVLEMYTDMRELVLLDPVHEVDAAGWPNRLIPPET